MPLEQDPTQGGLSGSGLGDALKDVSTGKRPISGSSAAPDNSPYFMGNNAVVIPTEHGKEIGGSSPEQSLRIRTIAKKAGYWYEGVGELGKKGAGPEGDYLKRIGVQEARNNGSYDDKVGLSRFAGYTLFTNLAANPGTAKAIDKLPGNTVGDRLHHALTSGTATFGGQQLTPEQATSVLGIARQDGLDLGLPAKRYAQVLKQGESKMWPDDGGNPDGSSRSPLGNYAYQANMMRRSNLSNLANSRGGVYFIGRDHLPALRMERDNQSGATAAPASSLSDALGRMPP